jgi:hypothetical protein
VADPCDGTCADPSDDVDGVDGVDRVDRIFATSTP